MRIPNLVSLKKILKERKWGKVKIRIGKCPLCNQRLFLKLDDNEWLISCLFCHATVNAMAIGTVLNSLIDDLKQKSVYELSPIASLHRFLVSNAGELTTSEYFDNVLPGEYQNNIQCQDIQNLTYPDATFDVCICSEVFEHVQDDMRGLQEIYRVLKSGGFFVFTVPLYDSDTTTERISFDAGHIVHLMPAEYHGDNIRGEILCLRNYGSDILDRLKSSGFGYTKILPEIDPAGFGYGRRVIVAHKE